MPPAIAVRANELNTLFARDGFDDCDGLRALHQDPALRRGLGAAGRAEARDRYDWSQISRQLEELYLLAEENNARRLGKSR